MYITDARILHIRDIKMQESEAWSKNEAKYTHIDDLKINYIFCIMHTFQLDLFFDS